MSKVFPSSWSQQDVAAVLSNPRTARPEARLRSLARVSLACAALALSGVCAGNEAHSQAVADSVDVTLDSGWVRGAAHDGVESFKGIPYAEPPVGPLRWRTPQPVQPWRGALLTRTYGKDCLQAPFPEDAARLNSGLSEDCLFANVWRPTPTSGQKLPVMVWIYGGGFVNGGSSPAVYAGDAFAKKGVVFVSFNYRVGRFGFFAHPALTRENPDQGLLGNYGLMDQISALHWVRRNAQAFGGDSNNVTVFGESAGGFSILSLLTSPLASGLFHKAVIQSGGGRANMIRGVSLAQAEQTGVAFAATKRIDAQDADALAALRRLPAEQLVDGLNLDSMDNPKTFSGPMIDGKIVIGKPQDSYRNGTFSRVPLIIGANDAELLNFPMPPVQSVEEAVAVFGATQREAALHAYDPNRNLPPHAVAMAVAGDRMMVEPARFVAETLSAQGVPVWHYRFAYVADALKGYTAGAPHASEIPYVFNTLHASRTAASAHDQQVAAQMQDFWVNFAKFGDPNGRTVPVWHSYHASLDNVLYVAPGGAAHSTEIADPWKARLDLVRAVQ